MRDDAGFEVTKMNVIKLSDERMGERERREDIVLEKMGSGREGR